jgi:TRAP-type C4-dicarboxylate transport system permease small subunit
MEGFSDFVTKLSGILDKIAGLFLAGSVLLIVVNIILRAVFNSPFLGTYELVSLFSAALIGLSLAQCAVKNGHIAVTIVTDKLPKRFQELIDGVMTLLGLCFWSLAAWQVVVYGISLKSTGVVSPTTQIPFYPFVFLIAFGLFALCLVLFRNLAQFAKKVRFTSGETVRKEEIKCLQPQ